MVVTDRDAIMTASLSDLLTAAKNIVTALNNATQQGQLLAGNLLAAGATNSVKFQSAGGQGRVARLSVLVAGSAAGVIYDSASGTTGAPLCAIPMTVGVYDINLPFNFGLYVAPGTGQTATVSYSLGTPSGGNL